MLAGCGGSAQEAAAPAQTSTQTSAQTDAPADAPEPEPTETPDPMPAYAGKRVAGGSCGEHVTWALYEDGALFIGGRGPIEDYRSANNLEKAPWDDWADDVKTVVILDGVTEIGACAFETCALTGI